MKRELLFGLFMVLVTLSMVSSEENISQNNQTLTNLTQSNLTDAPIPTLYDSTNISTGTNATNISNSTSAVVIIQKKPIANESKNSAYNLTGPWSARCKEVNNRVDGRIKMYEEERDPHLERFNNLVANIEKMINRSESKGYDPYELNLNLIELKTKIEKFRTDYDLFIVKLTATRSYTCGKSEWDYLRVLNVAKAQLKVVRADGDDIKEFYIETVKKSIESLETQKKDDAERRKAEREKLREDAKTEREQAREQNKTQKEEQKNEREQAREQNRVENRTQRNESNEENEQERNQSIDDLNNSMLNRTGGNSS